MMAMLSASKPMKHDPLSFVFRRSLRPEVRQPDMLLRQKVEQAEQLHTKDLVGHYGCVNAIEFSHGTGQFVASGGDDRRVLLWNMEKALSDIGKPTVMRGEHNSNIFCVALDITNTTILSGGNDEQVIVHDINTGETKDVFSHEDAVYGLSPDPTNPSVFASSCDDGRVLIYDIRDSCADPFCLANYTSSMHSVMYNPTEPRLLATANAKEGVGLWDVRKPRSCLLRYGGNVVQQSCMSVRFNQRGDQLIALRRRLPPVLYRLHSHQPVCEFDHSGYYNSCTMKSISYAGDNDQYVLSGSDEFNLYMWAIPEDLSERAYINSAHLVLKGHRSIVNQVRFNPANHLIISSGVEKIIKVWSPFQLPSRSTAAAVTGRSGGREGSQGVARERPVYSHEEYINLVLQDGHVMSHDYSHESTEEDPRMMAFFDSLVQRELEGWSSDDSLSSNEQELFSRIVQLSQTDIDTDDSINDPPNADSEDDASFSPFTIAFASVMASQGADGNDRFPRLNAALSAAERGVTERSTAVPAVLRSAAPRSAPLSTEVSSEENGESEEEENGGHTARPATTRADTQLPATRPSATHTEPVTNEEARKRNITEMVKKKKRALKDTFQRRLRDCTATLSSSSESDVSDSESEAPGKRPAAAVRTAGESDIAGGDCSISHCSNNEEILKKRAEGKKQAQLRVRKLRNLRQSILNSDSDPSDVDLGEKQVSLDIPSITSLSNTDTVVGKVQFKKLNKGHKDKAMADAKHCVKARASPDRGPYLQHKTFNNTIDARSAIFMEENKHKKGKSSSCQSHKGKILKTDSKQTINTVHASKNTSSANRCQRRTKSEEYHIGIPKPVLKKTRTDSTESESKKAREEDNKLSFTNKKIRSYSSRDINNSDDTHKIHKNTDLEQPSCSYAKPCETPGSSDIKVSNTDKLTEHSKQKSGECKSASSSEDEVNPTWNEFKRFKNKLERARRHYRDHKASKRSKQHYSDDDV